MKLIFFNRLIDSSKIVEAYKLLEAPQDYIQIEQIADMFSECEELRYENWRNLDLSEKVNILNNLEIEIAGIEHRQPCPIRALKMPSHQFGGYSPDSKSIDINASYIDRDMITICSWKFWTHWFMKEDMLIKIIM